MTEFKKFEIGKSYLQSIAYAADDETEIDFEWTTKVIDRYKVERFHNYFDVVVLKTTDYNIYINGELSITADYNKQLLEDYGIPLGINTYYIDPTQLYFGYESSCDMAETWVYSKTEVVE